MRCCVYVAYMRVGAPLAHYLSDANNVGSGYASMNDGAHSNVLRRRCRGAGWLVINLVEY